MPNRPSRELLALKEDPRFSVPRDDPGWFAKYMGEYTQGLRQTLERMQERIEQLQGGRGHPEMQADLSLLGHAITHVKDPKLSETQHVVTVQFLLSNALIKNANGTYTLDGPLNANGNMITNMGRSRFATDPQTSAEILGMIGAALTTVLPTTIQAGDTGAIGTETKGAHGDHEHPVQTAVAGDIAAVADAAAAGTDTTIPRGGHVHRGVNYSEGTFTITGTGFVANPTGTARWESHRNIVVLFLPSLTGTSNAITFTLTGLPAAIQPTQTSWHVGRITENGTDASGLLRCNSGSTTLDLFATAGAGAWTAAGTKTLYPCVIAYARV